MASVPAIETPRFVVGDKVHALEDGSIGVIEFVRTDGWCGLQWPTGTRECIPQDRLCGPLAPGG
jgi:hypothetical protein